MKEIDFGDGCDGTFKKTYERIKCYLPQNLKKY